MALIFSGTGCSLIASCLQLLLFVLSFSASAVGVSFLKVGLDHNLALPKVIICNLINCILFISKPLPFLNRTLICKTIFTTSTSTSILDPLSFLSSKRDLTTLLLKTRRRFALILSVTSIPSAPSWQWLQEHQTCW